jgi:hypothetical protein
MRRLTALPPALAVVVSSFFVTAAAGARTIDSLLGETDARLQLTYGDTLISHEGIHYHPEGEDNPIRCSALGLRG